MKTYSNLPKTNQALPLPGMLAKLAVVLIAIMIGCLPAAVNAQPHIVWISLNEDADNPDPAVLGIGLSRAPDAGYTDLLESSGAMVTRVLTPVDPDDQETIDLMNSADVVIASRAVLSGGFQNDLATFWNTEITAPVIHMSGYIIRMNRMGFVTGNTIPDTVGVVHLTADDPDHPVFDGIDLDGSNLMVNPFADVVALPNGEIQRGISVLTDPIGGNGNLIATVGTDVSDDPDVASDAIGGLIIGEWQAGDVLTHDGGAGTDTLAGPRMVFLSGSREQAGTPVPAAGEYDLFADGERMFYNAVNHMGQIDPPLIPPPRIENISPAPGSLFVAPDTSLTFTVTSVEDIPTDGITVIINGEDVSSELDIGGTSTERNVSFTGFEPNEAYNIEITATNVTGTRSATTSFDTFTEDVNVVIEAEDFNFDGGQFFDDIVLCNDFGGSVEGCYFDRISVPNVDALDNGGIDDNRAAPGLIDVYRVIDDSGNEELVDTFLSDDVIRSKFADAPEGANGEIQDYDIEVIDAGDWWNYTRTFEDSFYRVFLRVRANTDVTYELAQVTSDRTQENQDLDPLGSFEVPGGGGYKFVPLTTAGDIAAVVPLDGVQTLRLTALDGGAAQRVNFLMLSPVEGIPTIVDIESPQNGDIFEENSDITVTATATGPDGTAASITQVEFFASLNGESMSLGVDTEAPFEITTNALGLGNWELTAAATADDETGAVSLPVSIVVDSTPPSILGIQNGVNLDEIVIAFDEPLDQTTAENTANYSIDPSVNISGAQLLPNQRTVVLTTDALTAGTEYTVTVTEVEDPYGNAIAETSVGLTAEEAVSIAINFAAGRPDEADPDNSSFVDGPAGVLMTANWNNTEGANGETSDLLVDVDGEANETFASVSWSAAGTWASAGAGEDNNTAPEGEDRNLMTGYVDNTPDTPIVITASSIPFDVYDVYVYIKGGVTGRGGEYTIDGETQEHTVTTAFTGDYVLGSEGDYLIFQGVTGSSFTLTADATNTRAPVNAIEIVSTQRAALERLDPLQFGEATIAINFAADEPGGNRSDVEGPAGARRVANWNNVDLLSGEQADLVADAGGAPVATSASVVWSANNTWRTTDAAGVNTAPGGEDRDLMTGYLDNDPAAENITITVSDLPFGTYDVYVYILGDNVTGGRGGDYTIGETTIEHIMTTPFDGDYVEGADGNYEVFRGVTGGSFTLTADPTMGSPMRAPITGIEIVNAVPTSLAISFAADEPGGNRSDVDGPAGVLETGIWNNVDLLEGEQAGLIVDLGGAPLETDAGVVWSANNTWRTTDAAGVNTAPEGEDRDLMTGYLDNTAETPISIEVTNVPFGAYDVYVYILGDNVTGGRGGDYTIGNQTIEHIMTMPFTGDYVEGVDGNYEVFRGLSGSSFTLTATATMGSPMRAPINAIEIVPAGGVAAGVGGGVLLTIGLNGDGTVTIGWTGDGTLQMTPTLSPPDWQDVAGQTNPYTTDATAGDAFFRVVQ